MKAIPTELKGLRAYMAFVFVTLLLVTACRPDPDPMFKAKLSIGQAENITLTEATIVASVIPNEADTKIAFEFKSNESNCWQSRALPLSFSGKNSVKVTFDLSDLEAGTDYRFRVKATNEAGEAISDESKFSTYAVTDIDGNMYHSVKIGNQIWLQENFKATHYTNGEEIANVTDGQVWGTLTTGAYCWYNSDPKLGQIYGGLYNFYTIADPRGFVPKGWHVPNIQEWEFMRVFLGGYQPAGPALMATGLELWTSQYYKVSNSTGFTGLPNGAICSSMENPNFIFRELGTNLGIWTATAFGPGAIGAEIANTYCFFSLDANYPKETGMGIRLIKDSQ